MIDPALIRARFACLSPHLDERGRRLLAASEAQAAGHGGIVAVLRDRPCAEHDWARLARAGCGSAVGFGADQHHTALRSQSSAGSHACANPHRTSIRHIASYVSHSHKNCTTPRGRTIKRQAGRRASVRAGRFSAGSRMGQARRPYGKPSKQGFRAHHQSDRVCRTENARSGDPESSVMRPCRKTGDGVKKGAGRYEGPFRVELAMTRVSCINSLTVW